MGCDWIYAHAGYGVLVTKEQYKETLAKFAPSESKDDTDAESDSDTDYIPPELVFEDIDYTLTDRDDQPPGTEVGISQLTNQLLAVQKKYGLTKQLLLREGTREAAGAYNWMEHTEFDYYVLLGALSGFSHSVEQACDRRNEPAVVELFDVVRTFFGITDKPKVHAFINGHFAEKR